MTTISKAPAPRLFWCSAGDVMMRMANSATRIDLDQQLDLLGLFDDEKNAALASADTDAWIATLDKAHQLTEARIEAGRWARASGGLSDIARRAA